VYWYHPHIREDYGQELCLYGNIIVVPAEPEYWPPANRELTLTLDDVLLDEEGRIAPFSHHETTYVAMGRFGNVLLIGGETDLALRARLGEVMRFYFTDTANTRVFKVGLPGARMKLVGATAVATSTGVRRRRPLGAVGASRVDVLFEEAGRDARAPHSRAYVCLASITVDEEPARASFAKGVPGSRTNPDLVAGRAVALPRGPAGQDSCPRRRDGPGRSGRWRQAPSSPVPCIPRSSPPGPASAPVRMKLCPPSRIEAPTAYACPMHPR
jgi:hypothetical protein